MNEKMEKLKNIVITSIVNDKDYSEKNIEDTIKQFSMLSMFKMLSNDELENVKKCIHSDFQISLDMGVGITSKTHIKWFKRKKVNLSMDYWNRYKDYLIGDKNFPINVVNSMDDITDELTDLLGEPNLENHFQRRGLIIGDVQSGKTANYTGLICKAADAGYKVIVLLTGTIEKLRKQTQIRLDEGFIGKDSDAMLKQKESIIGAGKYKSNLGACVFTSKGSDFNVNTARNLGLTLNSINDPVLFVIKKNVTNLKNLNSWLKTFNLANGASKINTSLLMVDDEADNASINTNKADKDPTQTNKQIREMLSLFKKASYVGFTATPFANIFIEPNSDNEMENEDLFPKDYIYSLDAPTNYIGARNIFGSKAKFSSSLRLINDVEDIIPMNHKISLEVDEIPNSLRKAINQFLLINAIRDLRGDTTTHRSMIINVSRFVNVQRQIGDLVNNYLKEVQTSIRLYSKLNEKDAMKDKNINYLFEIYNRDFINCGESWDDIQNIINSSIEPISCMVVNQKSYNSLNYEENEQYGLRTIIVGGLSLSRGLTLEGLCVSYFYRNSKMYDTLMQMGRWFGYRKNYEDLCKIWMDENSIDWYGYISDATDELRIDVKKMKEIGSTPLEFGFRVRNDITALMVTALNKMRTAANIEKVISLSSVVLETPKLFNDDVKNRNNHLAINKLKNDINNINIYIEKNINGTGWGYKNIPKNIIIEFLANYEVSLSNIQFDIRTIIEFLNSYMGNELNNWDIVFINGSSTKEYEINNKVKINLIKRNFGFINENKILQISDKRNRLGTLSDSRFGLEKDQIELIELKHGKENKAISQIRYFQEDIKRNPLLMIYMIDSNKNLNKKIEINDIDPIVGISIGIPNLTDKSTNFAKYKINLVSLSQTEEYNEIYEGEDYE